MQIVNLDAFVKEKGIITNHQVISVYRALKAIGMPHGVWLAGGSIMSLVANRPHTSDYDLFFSHYPSYQAVRDSLLKLGATIIFTSPNAISLSFMGHKLQLISRKYYYGVTELFSDFDFTISMFAIDFNDNLYYDDRALQDLKDKVIRIVHVNALGETFKRVIKYGKKGFSITTDTYEKLIGMFSTYSGELNETIDFDKQIDNGGITFEEEYEGWSFRDESGPIKLKNKEVLKEAKKEESNYDKG